MRRLARKVKIIATVGPACASDTSLRALIRAGADVLRINASHTSTAALRQWVGQIRRASRAQEKPVSILLDLQGPRIRTGRLEGGQWLTLKQGDEVVLETGDHQGHGKIITTPYRRLPQVVKIGSRILLDNGLMELRVAGKDGKRLRCHVIAGGSLGENKGINLPDIALESSSLTAKDSRDLKAGIQAGVDYIALSFVRGAGDIALLRSRMRRWSKKQIPLVAKIEKPEAVKNIDGILAVADGIMVARGDLGIEMGVEKIPMVQKRLIEKANRHEIPVITATQMLESMIASPRPTRAEVSDVANAVFDGTDAVMLSGETAVGKFAVASVRTMSSIVMEAERHTPLFQHMHRHFHESASFIHAIAHAGQDAARELGAKALVVFTRTGKMAVVVSKLKPAAPVIVLTDSREVYYRLCLLRGVVPLWHARTRSTDRMVQVIDRAIVKEGLLKRGDTVVIVSGRQALPGARYMTKIHKIGEN